ncbi:MAG: hypothetical protein OXR66_08050 [Candidatus Woesearchaeota archaeon]|nr:hypothetical protein [Candidatus Woesearchaeota archaeon]
MASYLGKNINLTLLVIIIGVVVALVGTTVFFQRGLQSRTTAYEETSGSLDECNAALANYQDLYLEAESQANESAEDIRKYDQLYEQKVGELQDSSNQLSDTQNQLAFERLQKEDFQEKYENAQADVRDRDNVISSLNSRVTDLQRDKSDLAQQLAACESG